jgi:SSS family solute:Na+ symporter
MSVWIAWRQKSGTDYFLAARSMGGAPLAMSILANQVSAVSLIGAPAFVALRPGGGLAWLQYELALPLAMVAVIHLLLPRLRSVRGASIYEFLEQRCGLWARRVLAAAFLLSRGLALGVILYASSLVMATVFEISNDAAILLVGFFSVAYTSLGGIVADIWSDLLQLVVLWAGTIAACGFVLFRHGFALVEAVPAGRMAALRLDSAGVGAGNDFAFLPMFLGGLFLYASYYGCDQSQAQRLLTAKSDGAARQALLWNGLLRFPLVLTYCFLGVLLAGLLKTDAGFAAAMSGRPADSLVPVFITEYLPGGLRGIFIAAIFAAAMSSIDSALNSLAAVTLDDVFRYPPDRQTVWLSRGVSLAWGIFAVMAGLAFARSRGGVIELINQIGSAVYGPVLAVFLIGALFRGVSSRAVVPAFAAGLSVNLLAAWLTPVSWLWWNPLGFLVTGGLALWAPGRKWDFRAGQDRAAARVLLAATLVILLFLAALTALAASRAGNAS